MALGTAVAAIRAAIAALNDFDAAAADESTELLRGATGAALCCDEGRLLPYRYLLCVHPQQRQGFMRLSTGSSTE